MRELRRDASGILRRVAEGETVEVTDRGRPVAILVQAMPSGLARLEREGLLRPADGDLLDAPIRSSAERRQGAVAGGRRGPIR